MKERKRVDQGKDGRETGLATCAQHFCSGSRLESSGSEPNASHTPDFSEGGQKDRREVNGGGKEKDSSHATQSMFLQLDHHSW